MAKKVEGREDLSGEGRMLSKSGRGGLYVAENRWGKVARLCGR